MLLVLTLIYLPTSSLLVVCDEVVIPSSPISGNGTMDTNTLLLIQLTQDMKEVKEIQVDMLQDIAVLKQSLFTNQADTAKLQHDFKELETSFEGKLYVIFNTNTFI